MAPSNCTTPPTIFNAAFLVLNGAFVQPLIRLSAVNPFESVANDAPSREVKHWALLISVSAWTPTPPPGPEIKRPLVALHMSTGKYTPLTGRNFAESVKAASLMGFFVFMAPAKWTIPSMFFTAGAAVLG